MNNIGNKINPNLNQNLWGLVVGLGGLGAAEYFHLCTLYWISLVVSVGMVLSLCWTVPAHAIRYVKDKLQK